MKAFYTWALDWRARRRLEACNHCGAVIVPGLARQHIDFHLEIDRTSTGADS